MLVEGELQEPRVYEAKDGEHRASLDVRAYTVKFLGGRGESTEATGDADEAIPF